MKTSFIYMSCKQFDGTVFVTQIADWIRLYNQNGLPFQYIHLFYGPENFKRNWKKAQIEKIKSVIPNIARITFTLPQKWFLPHINAWNLRRIINQDYKDSDRIVIFARMMYGKEMNILKKISKKEIVFIYDGRGASYEEHKYNLLHGKKETADSLKLLSHIKEVERETVNAADRVFCVSKALGAYYHKTYGVDNSKFFLYPCLSDAEKFYYDEIVRENMRQSLGYTNTDRVYLYSGGLKNKYHLVSETLAFLNNIAGEDENAKFLFLSKDNLEEKEAEERFPNLIGKATIVSAPNEEVYKYLNAADYGLLFRDNVVMNNVASPSKFAEYVLCGLPVLISEGVGDYSVLCQDNDLGIVVRNFTLTDETKDKVTRYTFNREFIADFGLKNLSKQSQIHTIIKEFSRYND